eukprot:m.302727 g.302727  ORF g.302727 m.302727 type:complete len:285 (-) comp15887_c0_seq2:655-1509(-)
MHLTPPVQACHNHVTTPSITSSPSPLVSPSMHLLHTTLGASSPSSSLSSSSSPSVTPCGRSTTRTSSSSSSRLHTPSSQSPGDKSIASRKRLSPPPPSEEPAAFSAGSSVFASPAHSPLPQTTTATTQPLDQNQSLKGTPDYLAPELLLGTGHNSSADIWSLGIIGFEFLVGCPPFNDDTKELVFQHILDHDMIPLDEPLPEQLQAFIDQCLCRNPDNRPSAYDLKSHSLFVEVDFDNLRSTTAPFVPHVEDQTDTTYFEEDGRGKVSIIEDLAKMKHKPLHFS